VLRQVATADDPSRIINVGSIDAIRVSQLPCTPTPAARRRYIN